MGDKEFRSTIFSKVVVGSECWNRFHHRGPLALSTCSFAFDSSACLLPRGGVAVDVVVGGGFCWHAGSRSVSVRMGP